MTIKNYIINNRKKTICISLVLMALIVSLFIVMYVKHTNAGVFVKDDAGNYIQTNEINILEIVARDGQQVIGYTVEGQEPITIEKIENYSGPMDLDVDDFKDATGYAVSKKNNGDGTFSYKVTGSELNHTFNENVLGDSMAAGEIKVKAVQANALTTKDVEWADLIYINSKDNNNNLLYYYDQFMCDGRMNIQPGEMGENFNDIYISDELKSALSMKRICMGAGDASRAGELTEEDFCTLQLTNYQSCNLDAYKTALIGLEYDALTGTTDNETLSLIDAFLSTVNSSATSDAIALVRGKAQSGTAFTTDEEKAEFVTALSRGGWSGYISVNDEAYCQEITNYSFGISAAGVGTMIDQVNGRIATEALNSLVTLKARANAAIAAGTVATETADEYGFTPEDYFELSNCFKKANLSEVKDALLADYTSAFLDPDFDYTSADSSKIRTLLDSVNQNRKDEVLTELADSIGDSDLIDTFAESASTKFSIADISGYNKYYSEAYVKGLYELTDINEFKTSGAYDISKIEAYIADINAKPFYKETKLSCDMMWRSAIAIYNAAINENVALMYNNELLTNKEIGDYETDLSSLLNNNDDNITDDGAEEDTGDGTDETVTSPDETEENVVANTNNVYKMLLLLRQIRDTYYTANLAANIDGEGVYYPAGVDAGTGEFIGDGISSWYKETFGNDFVNPDGSVNYAKYHEPDVVGQTYGDTGVMGSAINYVYKRIYSFSGEQFFGGTRFLASNQSDTSGLHKVITAQTGHHNTLDSGLIAQGTEWDDIIVNISQNSAYYGNQKLYAHYWTNNNVAFRNSQYRLRCTPYLRDSSGKIVEYRVRVPKGYNNLLFTPQDSWRNKTPDFYLGDDYAGKRYYVLGDRTIAEDTSGKEVYLGGITKPGGSYILSGNYIGTMDMQIWGQNIGTPEHHAEYVLKVGNTVVYSGNQSGIHYTEGYMNGSNQPFKIGDTIKILDEHRIQVGDDVIELYENVGTSSKGGELTLAVGTVLNIEFTYYTETVNGIQQSHTHTYSYTKKQDPFNIDVSNVIANGVVEYAGYVDIHFNYSNLEYVTCYIDGGGYQNVANGDFVRIGEGLTEGASTDLIFEYKPVGVTTEYKVKTTLNKVSLNLLPNYLSMFTANNNEQLSYDNTLSVADNLIITNGDKGEIIRYILGVVITEFSYPLNILEIQPAAAVTELDSYEGAKRIADYLNINANALGLNTRNYQEFFNVTYMSVKEFNTRNEDLTAKYDLIYIGVDSGYQVIDNYTVDGENIYRTRYNDTSMKGLVYTGIGDKYTMQTFLKGTAASDYVETSFGNVMSNPAQRKEHQFWKNYFFDGFTGNSNPAWNLDPSKYYLLNSSDDGVARIGGNDLTVKKMDELLNYLKAGYPILLADEVMDCDTDKYIDYNGNANDAKKWRYVDINSKMYNFILQAKALGYDQTTQTYTGKDADGNNVFLDGKTYPSLVSVSHAKNGRNPDNLPANEKLSGGLVFAYKRIVRVEFSFESGPTQYNKESNGTRLPNGSIGNTITRNSEEYKTYKMKLKLETSVTPDQLNNYAYQVYVDKSGVGKFNENNTITLNPSVDYELDENGKVTYAVISGNWPGNIEGFIPWKVEAYNVNNPELKFSYVGFSAFEMINNAKKDVYVLWVKTTNGDTTNLNFKSALDAYGNMINDYDIHLITMQYPEFVNMWQGETAAESLNFTYDLSTSKLKVNTVKRAADRAGNSGFYYQMDNVNVPDDKELDMIVLGFADSYVGLDISSIPALKNIEYFVDAGHSLLFSHDNASYLSTMNYYTGNGSIVSSAQYPNATPGWGRYTTSYLRNLLGMDTYGVMSAGDDLSESAVNARKYLNTTEQSDYRGISELCLFHYTRSENGCGLYSGSIHAAGIYRSSYSNGRINNWCHTNLIMKTNSGQITEYPFVLDEQLSVATTHSQYMTLNVEDEDTTVWYVLDDDTHQYPNGSRFDPMFYTFTKGDGTNNYYIYSKGNITYTGAGHSSIESSVNEKKLFINTVVAALKAGNYKPEVELPNAYRSSGDNNNYINYYTGSAGVAVEFRPYDYDKNDNTNAFTDCKIYVDVDDSGDYTNGDILLNDPNSSASNNTFMHDLGGQNKINYVGTDLLNRVTSSFFLTNDDIAAIEALLPSGKEIDEFKIFIQVSDLGNEKSKNPIPAIGSNSFKLVKKEGAKLFNLN